MKIKFSLGKIVCLSILAQLCFFFSISLAQSPPAPNQNAKQIERPSIKDLLIKRPYVSVDLNYSISLPDPTYSNNWIFQEGKIGISTANPNITGGKQTFEEFNQINNDSLLSKVKGHITDKKLTDTDNLRSSVTFFSFDNGSLGIRKYVLSDDRLYVMFALIENSVDGKFFEDAFGTFKLVGESEIKAEIQRRFEEAAPNELPQEPKLKNWQSDAQEENLKGKVKKIIEEDETIANDPNQTNRKLSETREYNKDGNLTKAVRIDYRGNPDSITVYGFIDGKRVSKSGYIKYSYNPPPSMGIPSAKSEAPTDTRYSMSYEKKFKDGKLIEKLLYSNNGRVIVRIIYEYERDQKVESIYSDDGKLNQKYVYRTDKGGQIWERSDFDVSPNKPFGDKNYKFTYEFDKQGNWVKKITSEEVTEKGNTFFKPLYINYRTITYYD